MTAADSIFVNGRERPLKADATVIAILAELRLEPKWVIVEMNGTVLAREKFAQIPLREGDRLEIVQAIAGG